MRFSWAGSALLLAGCAAPVPGSGAVVIPAQPAWSRDAGASDAPRVFVAARTPRVATPFLRDVTELAVGHSHVCALTARSEVVCWGDNAAGQLGIGEDNRSAPPNLARPHYVGGLPSIAKLAAGKMHTCAIDREGSVFCWGSAGANVVQTKGGAAGSIELRGTSLGLPVRMPLGGDGDAKVVALSNRESRACVAFAEDVRCWNTAGVIPIDAKEIDAPPINVVPLAGVTALASGHGNVCAIAKGQLSCWRDGTSTITPAVRMRGDTSPPAKIAIGESYACVASTTGELRCWSSLLDDFWKKPPNRDVRWPQKTPTRAVVVGDSPICTADRDGRIDCFLAEETGLTDQAAAQSWATKSLGPHPIAGVDGAIDLGLGLGRDVFGYGFGCALRGVPDARGAQVFCWGDNESGQLGIGNDVSTLVAAPVLGAK